MPLEIVPVRYVPESLSLESQRLSYNMVNHVVVLRPPTNYILQHCCECHADNKVQGT